MPLGLDQLTNDQLLELTLELSQELAQRDPWMRNMAQATITTEAEKLELARAALKEAAGRVLREYIEGVRAEALAALKEGFRNGTARILTSTQEARIVVDGTLEAKIKLCEETVAAIQAGKAPTAVKPKQPERQSDSRLPQLEDFKDFHDFEKDMRQEMEAIAEMSRQADDAANAKLQIASARESPLCNWPKAMYDPTLGPKFRSKTPKKAP